MQFLKNVLSSLVALTIFTIGAFFIGLVFLGAIVSMNEVKVEAEPNSVLHLRMEGSLQERSQKSLSSLFQMQEELDLGLDEILCAIEAAKTNDNIKGIVISCGLFDGGYASVEEIRQALQSFKNETGKFIVAYSGAYTQKCYYLASVADKVYLNHEGVIDFNGISSSVAFYKGLLQNVGVEMQVLKVGTYKSYSEQYTSDKMSPANREQNTVLTQSIWKSILTDISLSRGVPVDSLDAAASSFVSFQSQQQCVDWGLVDGLRYYDEVEAELRMLLGLEEDADIPSVEVKDLLPETPTESLSDKKQVAVVYAVGEIDNGTMEGICSSELAKTLRQLAKDDDVSSVVLRVNSPGGSAYGSEQIWRAVSLLKEKKPVVVSMGDYAASGGYYLSCNANAIFAEPTTVTGSIGIFCIIPNAKGLMQKIGIDNDEVKTNPYADVPNLTRPLSESERNIMQQYVDKGYKLFVTRCSDGRKMPYNDLEKIAQGRVWSGVTAQQIGLVDALGTLGDAIKYAANLAEVSDYDVVEYPEKKEWYDLLTEKPSLGMDKLFMGTTLKKEYDVLDRVRRMERMQAIMPFEMDIR